MMQRFGPVSARTITPADAAFLDALYASTRIDLLHLPVPREVAGAIIRHQGVLQARGYAASYPEAHYLLLERGGVAIGRLVLNEAAGEIRVVDLSIAPAARRQGHARSVLRALQERAAGEGRILTLRVRKDNPPARALYAALGFTVAGSDDTAEHMHWTCTRAIAAVLATPC